MERLNGIPEDFYLRVCNLEARQEEWKRRRKRRLMSGFVLFLLLMLLLTFAARVIYTEKLPQVSWSRTVSSSLKEKISVEGTVSTGSPMVVYGMEELRVSEVCVNVGEQVTEGTVLYKVDTADLERCLEKLQAEYETWWGYAQNWIEGYRTANSWYQAAVWEAQRDAWRELLENDGLVRAQEAGTILELLIRPGDRMSGEPVIRYVNEKTPLMFRASISKGQKSCVHIGDRVTIRFSGNQEEISDTVDWIEEKDGGYLLTVWLEPGAGQGQTEGSMEINYVSQIYDSVIGIEALRNDGNMNFIYIMEEKQGILGTELSVRKLDIRVLEKSSEQAAIAEELLDGDTKIVTDSDKELQDGCTVREKE